MARPRFSKLDASARRNILETAAVEFAARGYDGASLNHILERADLSKGSFYYYFDDNCSAVILTLLEVAKPELELKSEFEAWVIPADTLRVVTRIPQMVRRVNYESSILTKFRWRYERLLPVEKEKLAEILAADTVAPDVLSS